MRPASVGFHCPECAKTGAQKVYRPGDLATRPAVTYALMAVSIVAYLAQRASSGEVTQNGLLFGPLVETEWWRLITSGFLHGSPLHLGFNMYLLYLLGQQLELAFGRVRFVLMYFGGLLAGSIGVVGFDYASPTLGASGAVLGLAGAFAASHVARGGSIVDTPLRGFILLNLLLPLLPGLRISFWGHFGGFLGGFAIAWILVQLPGQLHGLSKKQSSRLTLIITGMVVIVFGAIAYGLATIGGITTIG